MTMPKLGLVTGASGGIGQAIARQLVNAGYTVIIQGRDLDKLARLQAELQPNAYIVLGDLSKANDRQRILQESFAYGAIELLVNCAGVSTFASFTATTPEDLSNLMTINLLSPMQLVHQFIAKVNQKDSRVKGASATNKVTIINVGSAFGSIGYPGFSLYCASKFGLRGFTESLSREFADTNIRVAYFAPRATRTKINNANVNAMNKALGNACDSPDLVGRAFMTLLNSTKSRQFIGWPERLFVRLNGVFPELVDAAIRSKLTTIKRFLSTEKYPSTSSHGDFIEEK